MATRSLPQKFEVRAHWDAEAGVWWAESDDIPGLVTEAKTFDDLVGNVCALIPDLLELNGVGNLPVEVPVFFKADRQETVIARPT
jgi:predicted RNase H-like HicB family nuclease